MIVISLRAVAFKAKVGEKNYIAHISKKDV